MEGKEPVGAEELATDGGRSQAVRVLEADGAAKRGLLWSTMTDVVAEEEDEGTEGLQPWLLMAVRLICRERKRKESELAGRIAGG